MNVMARAHQLTRDAMAKTDPSVCVITYKLAFSVYLRAAHQEYKKMIASHTYRLTTISEKGALLTVETFETPRQLTNAMYDARDSAKFVRILGEQKLEQLGWVKYDLFQFSPEELLARRRTLVRIADEKKVAGKIVANAIKLGYVVSVYDGEEYTVKRSSDKAVIMAALYTTDMDRLVIRDKAGEHIGTVALVYGNSASEVMSDWHDSEVMNKVLEPAKKFCDELADKGL